MNYVFSDCSSLISLDLNSFMTEGLIEGIDFELLSDAESAEN